MTITIDVPQDVGDRLLSEAHDTGVPLPQIVRDVLIDHFEESEDRQVAEARLEDKQASISAAQMRRNLGLDN